MTTVFLRQNESDKRFKKKKKKSELERKHERIVIKKRGKIMVSLRIIRIIMIVVVILL